MNQKDQKRHLAYEALVILGLLVLLTYITRLWPLLLLMILGIFIATLRLLFLSVKRVEIIEPAPLLAAPAPPLTEQDLTKMAYVVIQYRISELIRERFPEARWVWENPRAKEDIIAGNPVYILLNHAGGYRRCKVVIHNLQVSELLFDFKDNRRNEPEIEKDAIEDDVEVTEEIPENYGLIAFQWVESMIMELNHRCNEEIAKGNSEFIVWKEELPIKESWDDICKELIRNGFCHASSNDDGIVIIFEQ